LVALVVGLPAHAQIAERQVVEIPRLDAAPAIEDFLGMQPSPGFAGKMGHVEGFIQQAPEDGEPSTQRTEVYFGYDHEAVYWVFVAHDSEPGKIRAHMNRRESIGDNDHVEVMLDGFGDGQRAFAFLVTAAGVQWDAIWTEGQGFDDAWDAVWQSRAERTAGGYVVWISIPFKSLRFPADAGHDWGLILIRGIPRSNENTFWPRVSNRIEGRLGQQATLRGLEGISPGRNRQIIPYATARNFELLNEDEGEFDSESFDAEIGLDAKLVFRDSLTLDATINPDFSQVESDQPQVTVNERFEVFFPERRPFFLENDDYFRTPINLLFTRRIADPSVGGRFTGKLGQRAIGVLVTDDEAPGEIVEPGRPGHGERSWVGVLRLRRDMKRQSHVGVLFTDREFADGYNRVGGIDGRHKLDLNWDLRWQAAASTTRNLDGEEFDGHAFDVSVNRAGRHLGVHAHYRDYAEDFFTAVGFVNRVDVRDLHQQTRWEFWPEGKRLISWVPSLFTQYIEDQDGLRLDVVAEPAIQWNFRRQTSVGLFSSFGKQRLRPEDFVALEAAEDFDVRRLAAWFSTRFINAFGANGRWEVREWINFSPPAGQAPTEADEQRITLNFTVRPGFHHVIDANYLRTELEETDGSATILVNDIARMRWNWQFTPKFSLRTILQYDRTRADSERTSIEADENLNADFLFIYLVNPWTAAYAGYNSNFRSFDLDPTDDGHEVVRPGERLRNDAQQLFVKLSYLYRF